MSDQRPEIDGAERELAEALGSLRPAETRIDRDALLFQAGQHSQKWRLRIWRGAAVGLAAMLALALLRNVPPPSTRPGIVEMPPGQPQVSETLVGGSPAQAEIFRLTDAPYLAQRDAVLRSGVDALDSESAPRFDGRPGRPLLDVPPADLGAAGIFLLRRSGGRL